MRVQLRLRSKGSVGVYLKANGFMPGKVGFNEGGPNTGEWVQDHTLTIRVTGDGVFNEVLRVAGNPGNPPVNRRVPVCHEGRVAKGAFIDLQGNLSAHTVNFPR